MKPITSRLRVLRAERNISQLDTAAKAGIPITRYWKIENGYLEPTESERAKLARVFRLTASEVFQEPAGKEA